MVIHLSRPYNLQTSCAKETTVLIEARLHYSIGFENHEGK